MFLFQILVFFRYSLRRGTAGLQVALIFLSYFLHNCSYQFDLTITLGGCAFLQALSTSILQIFIDDGHLDLVRSALVVD